MPGKTFINNFGANSMLAAPLYNWRRMLAGIWDFDAFRDIFLTSTGKLADAVVCTFPCPEECKTRKIVKTPDGRISAVCIRNENDYFYIPAEELIVYKFNHNALSEIFADTLMNYRGKRPEAFLLPEKIAPVEENIPEPTYPVQHVFPFAKRHIYKETDGENDFWYVDGENIGQIYKRRNSRKAKIINLLYNEIGNGWIPHQTFLNMTGWTEEEYFGKDGYDPGRMQRQLNVLRKEMGLRITTNLENGVKFPEEVVKSRNRSRKTFFK